MKDVAQSGQFIVFNSLIWGYGSLFIKTAGTEIIKLFSCSTQLNIKFSLLINFKLLTIVNSFLLNIPVAEHENFSANKYENANKCEKLNKINVNSLK